MTKYWESSVGAVIKYLTCATPGEPHVVMPIHLVFDILAAACAVSMSLFVYRWRLSAAGDKVASGGPGYVLALIGGAVAGGYLFGTWNLIASGEPGVGRSILGAMAGAIAAIETFKWWTGIKGSTGIVFVPAFATSVAVGRIGCYLTGIEDNTHGILTTVPWAHDFGDGILRHPVQLYESASMAAFLVYALIMLRRRDRFFLANGFYLLTGWYAGQRFVWEWLKPYGTVLGPFNVFHLVCAGLMIYACAMIRRGSREVADVHATAS
jgi:phosphatidylglycerol:prolipoprotein diacylglycerol transferase